MYMEISFLGFSASKKSNCAVISDAIISSTDARYEDDPLLQEPGIDVICPLAAIGLFDHHGDESVHVDIMWVTHCVVFLNGHSLGAGLKRPVDASYRDRRARGRPKPGAN